MSNSFGKIFKITTFGESHGGAVGVVIDGCPAGYKIQLASVQQALDRRRPGQSDLTSPRNEPDQVICVSGLDQGVTLGTPLTLFVYNQDIKKHHYKDINAAFRPSHADYTTYAKYGVLAHSGGGRASARETIGRVAAAAVAEQILAVMLKKFKVVAYVDAVKDHKASGIDPQKMTRVKVDQNSIRCPDRKSAAAMTQIINDAKERGDSVGGTIFCAISGVPAGLGAPVFDKLEADLAKAMMSLPATKGFEIGEGFGATLLFGSQHNDAFYMDKKVVRTRTNHAGGIQGGISNGEMITMRIAFKPVATIFLPQQSVTKTGKAIVFKPQQGRHDPCVLPRAVPIVEAMATLVIMDHYLRQQGITATRPVGKFLK